MKKEKKKKRLKKESLVEVLPQKPESAELPAPDEPDYSAENMRDPLQNALTLVGGKWKMRILWALRAETSLRYGEIKQEIDGITDMMLSQSLRELTEDGLTVRRQYQQIPPKVEYCITPAGTELIPVLAQLCTWSVKHAKEPT